jgi:predicted sulfurtransferase
MSHQAGCTMTDHDATDPISPSRDETGRKRKRLSRREHKIRKKNRQTDGSLGSPPPAVGANETVKPTGGRAKKSKKKVAQSRESNSADELTHSHGEPNHKESLSESLLSESDFLDSYHAVPAAAALLLPGDKHHSSPSVKALGKWFPKALVCKSLKSYTNVEAAAVRKNKGSNLGVQYASLLLFYQYTNGNNSWSTDTVDRLQQYLARIASHRNIGGRIRIAPEGVNATISAADIDSSCTARETLRHFVQDLRNFDPVVFQSTDFKFMDSLSLDRHFKDFKILPVTELVFYNLKEATTKTATKTEHVSPVEFHQLLQQPDTVVIDVRNHYEAAIGRFDGQMLQLPEKPPPPNQPQVTCSSSTVAAQPDIPGDALSTGTPAGATFIDPKMRKSTDFPKWLAKPETKELLRNKTVLMYCTGGVRCEKASIYVQDQLGSDIVGKVKQLQGGVERYLQTFANQGGGFWRGKNFVFDKRESVSAENPDGDGGIVLAKKSVPRAGPVNPSLAASAASPLVPSVVPTCCLCSVPWDRYVGKKKCYTCGVPVLMCDGCMTRKHESVRPRCPLCVEEGITVAAAAVGYTANGIDAVVPCSDGKAATTVLKWGGGHAQTKKQQRKLSRRACMYGTSCTRSDCLFQHPPMLTKNS